MSISSISLGTSPTGAGGDTNREAFTKVNANFTDLDLLTIQAKSGAYTLAQADNRTVIECNGTFTVTLPDGLTTGTSVTIVNVGSGTVTLAASTTLNSAGTLLATQWSVATAYHAGSNVWRAFGDLT